MHCIHEQTDRDVTLTSSFPSSFSYYKAFFPRRSPCAGVPVLYGRFSFGFVLPSTSCMFDPVTQAHFTVVPPAELWTHNVPLWPGHGPVHKLFPPALPRGFIYEIPSVYIIQDPRLLYCHSDPNTRRVHGRTKFHGDRLRMVQNNSGNIKRQ